MCRPLILILLLVSPWPATGEPFEPQPFRAEYTGEFRGLPLKARAVRELSRRDDGSFLFTSSASATLMKVAETTQFEVRDGRVTPLEYHYERRALGRGKQTSVRFDWHEMRARHDDTSSAISPGTLDRLGYQIQLRMDVAQSLQDNHRQPLEYTIADDEKRRRYRFSFIGEETLSTPAGDLRTVVLQRVREDREQRTTLWLALDHGLLMVRLKQEEPDRGFELNLRAFETLSHVEVTGN